ncbi:hypothetical protein PLESTB_000467000 [Pleodorina starrii]|uniref:Uncharacterized protein n=1 Tax=Pleodorina starrii TaxID=330485 RepID=A0A9W6BGL2_9CHLO|nr:hypothetical protein PLESTB_000467000 [Pleodorina starrii]
MKSKRTDTTETVTADAALQILHEYGERFMAMFDDEDGRKPSEATTSRRNQFTPHGKTAAAKGEHRGQGPDTPSTARGAQKRQQQDATPARLAKRQRQEQQQQVNGGQPAGSSKIAAGHAGSPAGLASGQRKTSRASSDEIDAIMRAGKRAKQAQSSKGSGGTDAVGKGGKVNPADAAAAMQSAAMAEALRRERKLFMSHKASKVHEAVQAPPMLPSAARASEEDAGLSPEEFQKLQLEVEKFAAGSLDKKSAKLYKARMLARIGSKGDTAPRTAASIGKGVAKMAAKRQARALEEAIETGMVQRKGLGKKKRALKGGQNSKQPTPTGHYSHERTNERTSSSRTDVLSLPCNTHAAKNRDRGLMEAGPSFKNGILRVKPMKKTRAESGKLRLPKGVL